MGRTVWVRGTSQSSQGELSMKRLCFGLPYSHEFALFFVNRMDMILGGQMYVIFSIQRGNKVYGM